MNTARLESEVLANIPEEFVERYQRLLGAPGLAVAEARTRLAAHLQTIQAVSMVAPQVDLALAATLTEVLISLHARHPTQHVVSAAIRYFLEEDEDDEITGVLGFADDVAVVRSVCDCLDAQDLFRTLLP